MQYLDDIFFGFPIVNFPWLSGDVPRLPVFTFRSWLDLLHYVLPFSILVILQITSLTQGYRYHKLRKHLESSLGHTLNFCPDFVILVYQFKNVLKESLILSSTVI